MSTSTLNNLIFGTNDSMVISNKLHIKKYLAMQTQLAAEEAQQTSSLNASNNARPTLEAPSPPGP